MSWDQVVDMASINSLPDEIVHQILLYVPPQQTLTKVARLSKRFHRVTQEPLLWRSYCQHSFRYWDVGHYFEVRLTRRVRDTDWKGLFLLRLKRNIHIAQLLENIIGCRVTRLRKIEQICQYGYDAKDFLLSQCQIPDTCGDVLARRYYACSVLDGVHRSAAIEEWAKYQKFAAQYADKDITNREKLNCGMRIERALGAFDMFMLHDNEGDINEISEILDDLASRFRSTITRIDEMTTRQKALALAGWLHFNNMTGLSDPTEETYRYLRNCLIGRAIRDEHHPSLPIISASIYSAIASRLDMEAYPCALPSHVHCMVLSPPGVSLDGQLLPEEESQYQENMFLDPYGSAEELPRHDIYNFLSRLGFYSGHEKLLTPTATAHIVLRTAQNIRASFSSFRANAAPLHQLVPMIELNRGDWARNLRPAMYSLFWARIMMVPALPEDEEGRWDWQHDVRDMLSYAGSYFPEDLWLIEKYVCPMYEKLAATNVNDFTYKRLHRKIGDIRRADMTWKTPRRRRDLKGITVKFRIGQVFKHKRYDYYGLIIGWSAGGLPLLDDVSLSPVNRSWPTQDQHYYRCMVATDGSDTHVIAEENIEVLELRGGIEVLPTQIKDLLPMAGRFFKRWDPENGVFVSNLRELYPED